MVEPLTVVWDFNPVLVTIFGFEIRYYSLMWAAALLVGAWIFSYFCKREGKSQELADSAFLYIALGTMIGARVGHCLFYEPEYYLLKPWAIITEIRDGGLASHGATIGIILAIWLCSRKNRVPAMWMTDRLGVIAPISGALIRFGNLFNSEIIGNGDLSLCAYIAVCQWSKCLLVTLHSSMRLCVIYLHLFCSGGCIIRPRLRVVVD